MRPKFAEMGFCVYNSFFAFTGPKICISSMDLILDRLRPLCKTSPTEKKVENSVRKN